MPKIFNMYKLENYLKEHRINFNLPSPIQKIEDEQLDNQAVTLYVKREDLIGENLTGNKYRKLIFNIQFLKENSYDSVVTYGGAFSNHIHAVAAAGKLLNFNTIGIIRGEEPKKWSPTLQFAKASGMQLHFVDRQSYTAKNVHLEFNASEKNYLIPEGGTNGLAIKGCQDIVNETLQQIKEPIDHWMVCCGTGGTAAGMISAMLEEDAHLTAFQILKGKGMMEHINQLLKENNYKHFGNWNVNDTYHFGGYAKWNNDLITFMNDFKQQHDIALDPIYTGKMMYGIFDMIEKGAFQKGSTIVAIHTGGLQGVEGFNMRFGKIINDD